MTYTIFMSELASTNLEGLSKAPELRRREALVEAPDPVKDFYAGIEAGDVTDFTSQSITVHGKEYVQWADSGIPDEGFIIGDDQEPIRFIPEGSIRKSKLGPGEIAVSAGFHDCTAVIWQKEGDIYFVHNSGDEPSAELRGHVIAELDPTYSLENIGQMQTAVTQRQDEKLLDHHVFDEVVVIARHPEDFGDYFGEATGSLVLHEAGAKDGLLPTENFDVWVQNQDGKIVWGILPHVREK